MKKYLMKKICSITLAFMLCVPTSVTAFAADDAVSSYENLIDVNDEMQNVEDAGDSEVSDNTGDVIDNTGDINDNAGDVTDNSGDNTDNTGDIADNTGDKDTEDISDNSEEDEKKDDSDVLDDEAVSDKENDKEDADKEDTEKVKDEKKEKLTVEETGKTKVKTSEQKTEVVKTEETLTYSTHVQSVGWQKTKKNGEVAGLKGKGKRVEAIKINVKSKVVQQTVTSTDDADTKDDQNADASGSNAENTADTKTTKKATGLTGSVEYRTYCQSYKWLGWKKDGAISGTVGKGKRMEAIQIRLTGELAEKYDIYYRVYSTSFGNLGWAKNGQTAGTCGFAKTIEAIQIKLVKKTSTNKPTQDKRSYYGKNDLGKITYSSHCQSYGWMKNVADGTTSGTKGKGKRMEAIRIYPGTIYDANGKKISGNVEYQVYCQTYGWKNWVKNGAVGGTTGEGKRMEAIKIRLTGELAEKYDVYYKVHCASWGDLGWAKNGEIAGTVATSRAIESIQIKLVAKNSKNKPSSTVAPSIQMNKRGSIEYETYAEKIGWTSTKKGPSVAGTTGKQQKIVAVRMRFNKNGYSGGVKYRVYLQGSGWQKWVSNGQVAGTAGGNKRIEAIQVKLTGEISKYCNVYYSSHIQSYGWLGWAKNGESSGSKNCAYRMEALKATISAKTVSAPGSTSGAFQTSKYKKKIASFTTVSTNDENGTYNMTKALLSFNGKVIQPGQTLSFFGVAGPCGAAQGYLPGGVVGGVGYGGGICQASTTLYGAAIRAGLTIVERRNHSVPSTYVPIGQDAMVDYGSSDLKIKNNLKYPVTIKTYVTGRTLHAEIYGVDPGWFDSVKINSWYTSGSSAAAERVFYKNGKIVKREALPSSFYY